MFFTAKFTRFICYIKTEERRQERSDHPCTVTQADDHQKFSSTKETRRPVKTITTKVKVLKHSHPNMFT